MQNIGKIQLLWSQGLYEAWAVSPTFLLTKLKVFLSLNAFKEYFLSFINWKEKTTNEILIDENPRKIPLISKCTSYNSVINSSAHSKANHGVNIVFQVPQTHSTSSNFNLLDGESHKKSQRGKSQNP